MNNTDYLITMVPVKGWNILDNKWAAGSKVKKKSTRKDLSNFDSGMSGPDDRSCGVFPECSGSYLPKMVQRRTTYKPQTGSQSLKGHCDVCMEQKLAHLVQSHRRATVAQITETFNAGCDWQLSEHKVHCSLLRMGLRSLRLSHAVLCPEGSFIKSGPGSNGRRWLVSDESRLLLHHANGQVCVHCFLKGEMRVWSREAPLCQLQNLL